MENNYSRPLKEFKVNRRIKTYYLIFLSNVSLDSQDNGTFYPGTDDSKKDEAASTHSTRNVTFPFD